MKTLFQAARPLLSDLFPTLLFAALTALTHDVVLSTSVAMAVGVLQVVVKLVRREPVGALQWMSLALVAVSGGATLVTHDARFMMFKPSLIYAAVGATMLQRGWMLAYVPAEARGHGAEPLFVGWGYAWAALLLATSALNAAVALHGDLALWARFVATFPPASKILLFAAQYLHIRRFISRRIRAALTAEAGA